MSIMKYTKPEDASNVELGEKVSPEEVAAWEAEQAKASEWDSVGYVDENGDITTNDGATITKEAAEFLKENPFSPDFVEKLSSERDRIVAQNKALNEQSKISQQTICGHPIVSVHLNDDPSFVRIITRSPDGVETGYDAKALGGPAQASAWVNDQAIERNDVSNLTTVWHNAAPVRLTQQALEQAKQEAMKPLTDTGDRLGVSSWARQYQRISRSTRYIPPIPQSFTIEPDNPIEGDWSTNFGDNTKFTYVNSFEEGEDVLRHLFLGRLTVETHAAHKWWVNCVKTDVVEEDILVDVTLKGGSRLYDIAGIYRVEDAYGSRYWKVEVDIADLEDFNVKDCQ